MTIVRFTKQEAFDLGYKNGEQMAHNSGSSEAPSDGWDGILINADPAFAREKFGWNHQDSDEEAISLLEEYCRGCQNGANDALEQRNEAGWGGIMIMPEWGDEQDRQCRWET